jgi:hypothetical protein
MTAKSSTVLALEDAVRALRDIAELDETRPAKNAPEKVAERALERISAIVGTDVHLPGRTARPDEAMFPGIPFPATRPDVRRVRREGDPFYTGPIGTKITKPS